MKSYKCLINSTAGLRGTIIELNPDLQQTKQRLERGIIAELKIEKDNIYGNLIWQISRCYPPKV